MMRPPLPHPYPPTQHAIVRCAHTHNVTFTSGHSQQQSLARWQTLLGRHWLAERHLGFSTVPFFSEFRIIQCTDIAQGSHHSVNVTRSFPGLPDPPLRERNRKNEGKMGGPFKRGPLVVFKKSDSKTSDCKHFYDVYLQVSLFCFHYFLPLAWASSNIFKLSDWRQESV